MTGGTDIQEFEEQHFEALVENFIENHAVEWNEYHLNADNDTNLLQQAQDFVTTRPEWARFVEIEYATRGAE